MAAYIIVQANITDKEKYKEYLNKVTSIVEKYSGEYLVRGGKYETHDGDSFLRSVVWEFPSYDKAVECHNSTDYQKGWGLAKETTSRHMQIIEGFSTE